MILAFEIAGFTGPHLLALVLGIPLAAWIVWKSETR